MFLHRFSRIVCSISLLIIVCSVDVEARPQRQTPGARRQTKSRRMRQKRTKPLRLRRAVVKQNETKSRSNSQRRALAVLTARRALGVPYRWGGTSRRGFDCSGLTQWCYRTAGVRIPRTASQQFRYGRAIATAWILPGDLVFFRATGAGRPGGTRGRISHVGMWVGGGQMIHAPRPGKRVQSVRFGGYWRRRFAGARRYL